jgi:hypothetical protein
VLYFFGSFGFGFYKDKNIKYKYKYKYNINKVNKVIRVGINVFCYLK